MKTSEIAEALETMRSDELKLKSSREYRIGVKISNALQDLKHFRFGKMISREIRYRKIAKYSTRCSVGSEDYNYGEYPDDGKRFVVYSCITGGYDKIQESIYHCPSIDYVLFTDNPNISSKCWQIRPIPKHISDMNNILVNRYIKFHPAELFPEYDYSVYIDGNIVVISDVRNMINRLNDSTGLAFHHHDSRICIYKEVKVCKIAKRGDPQKMDAQMKKYREEGMPEDFGMYEANIILSDLKNSESKKILSAWWDEFRSSESMRDQIALPYIIWKSGHKYEDIGFLGGSMFRNPKFRKVEHS